MFSGLSKYRNTYSWFNKGCFGHWELDSRKLGCHSEKSWRCSVCPNCQIPNCQFSMPKATFIESAIYTHIQMKTVYRWPLWHLKVDYEVIPVLRSLLTDIPLSPGKVATPPESTSFTLFEQRCAFFYVQQGDKWNCCELLTGFCTYPRRLEIPTVCSQHFLLSY